MSFLNLQAGHTAVITGAGSGFGLELARLGAARGLNLVLTDVQDDALDAVVSELSQTGASVAALRGDVSRAEDIQALADLCMERFGAPNLVVNNAGVASGGLIWEQSLRDWDWVLGVNLYGVIHGVHTFTPLMLDAARKDPNWRGHIVNVASMAGLLNAPNMGAYNVSKHAVVSLTETLYQDLALVTEQVRASVLCPYFVPTGIHQSHRNRPAELASQGKPTASQMIAQAMSTKAVTSGKVTAADVAAIVFDGVAQAQFYLYTHPKALGMVQTRLEDVVQGRNPTDPFEGKPEIGDQLRQALRAALNG
ncbi:MAG TPA: SDR family oxidoreductase [Aquabacterium sp.]|uniref:SDR family oxidoreductase n=1 Tax=Aquabacterium sp. TaxID=1872578 RepID=UPI002E33C794|nr:SDR family oxidoreductase [Aquabacterium sp.]HEX5372852.1 SDR family oxidoreductase [Aquabacterium sp.]